MTCLFETCDRDAIKRGMCSAHYTQWHRGYELKPLRPRKKRVTDATGAVCTKCDTHKPWSQYYKDHNRGGYMSWCIDCTKAYDRERTASGARRRHDG